MKVIDGERSFFVEKRFNAFVQFHDIVEFIFFILKLFFIHTND